MTDETVNDPGIQAMVDCSREGDIISLQTRRIEPPSRIVIPRMVVFDGSASMADSDGSDDLRPVITCPSGDGLFLIRFVPWLQV